MDRSQLSEKLNEMISHYVSDNKKHVFFQSPGSYQMTYPSIIYSYAGNELRCANNRAYRLLHKYQIMLISRDPDIELRDEISTELLCDMDKPYIADNLYHYVYTLYC